MSQETLLDSQTPGGDEPARALRAVQAETEAEQDVAPDGSIVVVLVTDDGEAPIRVPSMRKWRSLAKNALFSREDDLAWAAQTLEPDEVQAWIRLNPTGEDVDAFFTEWGEKTGQALGEALAAQRSGNSNSKRNSRRTNGR